jgi:hypothetical protein
MPFPNAVTNEMQFANPNGFVRNAHHNTFAPIAPEAEKGNQKSDPQ